MSNEEEKTSVLGKFLEKNIKVIGGLIAVLIVFVIVAVVGSSIKTKATEKGLSQVDAIEYTFKKDADDISAEDFKAKQDAALSELEALASKGGIVGVRANMLKAEILFEQKNYDASRSAWLKAADAKKSAYAAPLCYYNAAICSENLNDLEGAVSGYEKAISSKDFYLIDHAYFSLGRVNETKGDLEKAVAAYEKIEAIHSGSRWANLAKDRIIAINSAKAE